MGRLIDADAFKRLVAGMAISNNYPANKANAWCELIDAQPTAYDQDKVVEQLEERTEFLKDCTKYGNKTADQQSKSYDTMMMYEIMDLVDDLLEIVKAGVSDGN